MWAGDRNSRSLRARAGQPAGAPRGRRRRLSRECKRECRAAASSQSVCVASRSTLRGLVQTTSSQAHIKTLSDSPHVQYLCGAPSAAPSHVHNLSLQSSSLPAAASLCSLQVAAQLRQAFQSNARCCGMARPDPGGSAPEGFGVMRRPCTTTIGTSSPAGGALSALSLSAVPPPPPPPPDVG